MSNISVVLESPVSSVYFLFCMRACVWQNEPKPAASGCGAMVYPQTLAQSQTQNPQAFQDISS